VSAAGNRRPVLASDAGEIEGALADPAATVITPVNVGLAAGAAPMALGVIASLPPVA
jgi:hypothetical protein